MISKRVKSLYHQVLSFRPSLKDLPLFLQGVFIAVIFGELFYDSLFAVIVLLPVSLPWYIHQKKMRIKSDRRLIGIQFRDALGSVLTNMKAGYSAENAFIEARRDMDFLYGKKSLISRELGRIGKGIRNNVPLEKLILKFGEESGNDDIQDFAEVFAVAKKSGGNMTQIIGRTAAVISQKMDVEKEIDVLISAKRMEARIMNIVPFFIIFYVSLTSPGFFEPLYHNPFGIVLMTICMGLYIFAYLMSERIVNIDV